MKWLGVARTMPLIYLGGACGALGYRGALDSRDKVYFYEA
jgi:hypothetical protein